MVTGRGSRVAGRGSWVVCRGCGSKVVGGKNDFCVKFKLEFEVGNSRIIFSGLDFITYSY